MVSYTTDNGDIMRSSDKVVGHPAGIPGLQESKAEKSTSLANVRNEPRVPVIHGDDASGEPVSAQISGSPYAVVVVKNDQIQPDSEILLSAEVIVLVPTKSANAA